jgi:hypothetical protein
MTVEVVLSSAGQYHVFAVQGPAPPPRGELDEDRAALISMHVSYEERKFQVR